MTKLKEVLSKRCYPFLRREDGYTVAINLTFLFVTLGMVVLAMLMWFGTAMTAYASLRSAATSAAFAAQAQVAEQSSGSGTGFSTGVNWVLQSDYQSVANTLFETQASNLHLDHAFTNLQCATSSNGNQIIVTATGSYLPLFLQKVSQRYPVIEALSIPMKSTVMDAYKVVG
ncbi:hypothetical protein [Alicyclobacillus ferrooxydans]|uniref:Uncharacterized protein n=1 Tax=Alicyclobacillus ferrooxydans TaxID=471514 RepID=A0A0P9CS53_9BACL|nr:hypothetical protein [Alicyclobacillus ferrooxydans]KPV45650.1 hypothetical protein AN477_01680 [Alicyclobacillus ferrooxydans]